MLSDDLREAVRLTKAGRLMEATASIQRLLNPAQESNTRSREVDTGAPMLVRGSPDNSSILDRLRGLFGKRDPVSPGPVEERESQYLSKAFRNAAGSRPYKLYVPGGYHGQPVPLIVMLHGCKQSADDFAAGTCMNLAGEEHTCIIAYPEQVRSANVQKCWNWFNERDQRSDAGEPSLIAGITREVMHDYAIDARRVYVAGLSAGGAAAANMAASYPDLYAAFGVHSGLACGVARDLSSGLTAMRMGGGDSRDHFDPGTRAVPAIAFHGDRDSMVNPRNADQVVEQATRDTPLTTRTENGRSNGRDYTRTLFIDHSGRTVAEQWTVHGGAHAWSGGNPKGSFTDPLGPDATAEMLRFFLEHQL